MKFSEYQKFVKIPASDATNHYKSFKNRIEHLHDKNIEIQTLLTAGVGLMSESGEFGDIVKKIVFQNKEYDKEIRYKLIKELGDVLWYMAHACNALGISFETVMETNVEKLKHRFNLKDVKV